jgi:hypothetical protein
MSYTVTSDDTAGLAIGPVSEIANDVYEALSKARQMYETGLVNVSIKDEAGHEIDGDELLEFGNLLEQSPPPSAHRCARGRAHPLGQLLPLVLALANPCCDSLDG